MQTFATLIVSRFQNINPEKEGATVKGTTDIKNEIRVITLADDHYEMWRDFLEKHHSGSLVNPDTLEKFNAAKNFKLTNKFQLTREFFKHMDPLTDSDLRVYVQHLLGLTPSRTIRYPKVSVHKTNTVHASHHSGAEWVERRKRKRVVLEELVELKPDLKFITKNGAVDNDVWRRWKLKHRVSSGTWNILLTVPPSLYFALRLTNEGKLKRASELQQKYPQVLPFFRKFLHSKENLSPQTGFIRFRTQDSVSLGFHKNWEYNSEKALGFGLMDLREIPGHSSKDEDGTG